MCFVYSVVVSFFVEVGMSRARWAALSDDQLLAQCQVDTYRASGPGGQKRNKTSSAVRLRHPPSGLLVIAEESRSQHENRARARAYHGRRADEEGTIYLLAGGQCPAGRDDGWMR